MIFITVRRGFWKLTLGMLIMITSSGVLIQDIYSHSSPHPDLNKKAAGYVALVIDDFGNHGDGTDQMINLGIPITAAVMPFLPYSESDMAQVHNAGLEVILHVPMQPLKGKQSWLGSQGITCTLADEEIQSRLNEGLDQIKWAVGMNNHMGSKVMQDKRVMRTVLGVAQQRGLYFLDSRTVDSTVSAEIAQDHRIPFITRDVFLDRTKNRADIEKQLEKLVEIALEKGYAVGIGHVGADGGTVTAEAIKSMAPVLQERGIRFVFLSEIVRITE